jgi:hypothetical protein
LMQYRTRDLLLQDWPNRSMHCGRICPSLALRLRGDARESRRRTGRITMLFAAPHDSVRGHVSDVQILPRKSAIRGIAEVTVTSLNRRDCRATFFGSMVRQEYLSIWVVGLTIASASH